MKRISNILLFTYSFMFLLFLIPGEKEALYELISNTKAVGFSIYEPFIYKLFAPFIDIPAYFAKFSCFRLQFVSWIFWIYIAFGIVVLRTKKIKNNIVSKIKDGLKPLLIFLFICIYVVFFPYPTKSIKAQNKNDILIDYHSHSYYSWDGSASIKRSVNYHKRNGFDAYALTEHNLLTTSFLEKDYFKNNYPEIPVIFGTEVRLVNGFYYNIYNMEHDINSNPIYKDNYKKLFKDIKIKYGGIISSVLWWEYGDINSLLQEDVDALEIVNSGHPNLQENEREKAIKEATNKNLVMLGATDWHGWTYIASNWTVARIPYWRELDYNGKKNAVIDVLKGKYKTQVLRYFRRDEINTKLRYYAEPFFGIYYYFTSIDFISFLSWCFWITILLLLYKFIYIRKYICIFWGLSGSTIFALAFKFLLEWISLSYNNSGLKDAFISLFIIGLISTFIAYKEYKSCWRTK